MLNENGEKKSAVDLVVDAITEEIIRGELHPGDRLLTEPELSRKYQVGRNSVREAIKQLQAFGVVQIRRADGTYISETYERRMLDPMLYGLILNQHNWNDFVQLRAVMDIGTLHVVLNQPRATEIVPELEEIVGKMGEEMRSPNCSIDDALALDLRFHTKIVEIMDNPQVESVVNYVVRMTVPSRRQSMRKWIENGEIDRYLELHRNIIEVIRERDKSKIDKVVNEHYIYWR